MKLPSFSVASLMCVVATASINCYLVRQIDLGDDNAIIMPAVGSFIMVNVLAIGALRIVFARDRTGPFLCGFEIGGTLAILAYLGCFRYWPEPMEEIFFTFSDPIESFCRVYAPRWVSDSFAQASWDEYPDYLKFPILFAVLPIMTAPLVSAQLLVALAGGWTARVIIGRSRTGASAIAEVTF